MKAESTVNEGLISLVEFREFLFNPLVPLEDITDRAGNEMSKTLFYWRKKNLVPFIPSGKHTFSVSFAHILWFRILDLLRDFSYPEVKMKIVCDYFFKDAYFEELPKKNFIHHQRQLNKKKVAGTISRAETETLEFIEQSLKDETFLYVLRFEVNYLTNLITSCLEQGEDKLILIYRDGRVAERHGEQYYTHSGFTVDPTEPCILISLRYLLREFVKKEELAKLFLSYTLNDKEKDLLKRINDKGVKEITIKTKNGEIDTIEIKKDEVVKGEKAERIRAILGLKNYEQITIKTIDDKSLYIKTNSVKVKNR